MALLEVRDAHTYYGNIHALRGLSIEVEEGEMPLWYYLPLHPKARLSDGDKETLLAWASGESA